MISKLNINKSFLSSGKDFLISKSLQVKHPTIQEVLDIDKENNGFYSEDLYYSWVSVFLCDPYNYMVYLDDKKIDYEKIESFDLFIMLFQDMKKKYEEQYKPQMSENDYLKFYSNNSFFQAFKFFLNKPHFNIARDENNELVLADYETNTVMVDKKIFSYIVEFIKLINGIGDADKINPEDEFAKQILIDDERNRLKKLAKKSAEDEKINKNRLGNLLSAITWASSGSITPFNRNKLHMYDLVDGISRTDKLLNYNHTMTGLFSGCVNKDKINYEKISWQS